VGRLARVLLGGRLLVNQPTAVFSRDWTGVFNSRAFAGIIGGELLRRCKVIFDYRRRRMILEPYVRQPAPYEYDMSGTFLVADGPDFERFKVQSVAENTPAEEAGINVGDVVTTINGRPTSEYTLDQVRELFKKDGSECRLELERGEERFEVKLVLRRLV
jgi:membrane-associated protease RseP (regulator of RpoE activity)